MDYPGGGGGPGGAAGGNQPDINHANVMMGRKFLRF